MYIMYIMYYVATKDKHPVGFLVFTDDPLREANVHFFSMDKSCKLISPVTLKLVVPTARTCDNSA